jgi:hypothetical protein
MSLSNEDIESVVEEFFARSTVCRKYGIPLIDVFDGKATVPPGWALDPMMDYYMPPTLLES